METAMTKTMVSREELTQKVLAAVRQRPGCEGVREVAVTPAKVLDEQPTWHASVIDEGSAKPEVAHTAVRRITEQLVMQYEVIP
jgi:hypothetical protein